MQAPSSCAPLAATSPDAKPTASAALEPAPIDQAVIAQPSQDSNDSNRVSLAAFSASTSSRNTTGPGGSNSSDPDNIRQSQISHEDRCASIPARIYAPSPSQASKDGRRASCPAALCLSPAQPGTACSERSTIGESHMNSPMCSPMPSQHVPSEEVGSPLRPIGDSMGDWKGRLQAPASRAHPTFPSFAPSHLHPGFGSSAFVVRNSSQKGTMAAVHEPLLLRPL